MSRLLSSVVIPGALVTQALLPGGAGGTVTQPVIPASSQHTLVVTNNTGQPINVGAPGGCGNGQAVFSDGGTPEFVTFGEIAAGATADVITLGVYAPGVITSVWVDSYSIAFVCTPGTVPVYATQTGTFTWAVTLT